MLASRRRRRSSTPSSEDSKKHAEVESQKCKNIFQNDGSFLEMFKRMQETSQQANSTDSDVLPSAGGPVSKETSVNLVEEKQQQLSTPKTTLPFVGRRRSSKALPIGKVKKLKNNDGEGKSTTDAWAKYLEEVKKYKETYCDADNKNRPLVK